MSLLQQICAHATFAPLFLSCIGNLWSLTTLDPSFCSYARELVVDASFLLREWIFPNVEKLTCVPSFAPSNIGSIPFAKMFPKLKECHLDYGCSQFPTRDRSTIPVLDMYLQLIVQCPNIHTFVLRDAFCKYSHALLQQVFDTCLALRSVEIHTTHDLVLPQPHLESLKCFTSAKVTVLSATHLKELTVGGAGLVCPSLESLETLKLDECGFKTVCSWLSKPMPKLQALEILQTSKKSLHVAHLKTVKRLKCVVPNLQVSHLSSLESLSTTGQTLFAQDLPKLQTADLAATETLVVENAPNLCACWIRDEPGRLELPWDKIEKYTGSLCESQHLPSMHALKCMSLTENVRRPLKFDQSVEIVSATVRRLYFFFLDSREVFVNQCPQLKDVDVFVPYSHKRKIFSFQTDNCPLFKDIGFHACGRIVSTSIFPLQNGIQNTMVQYGEFRSV